MLVRHSALSLVMMLGVASFGGSAAAQSAPPAPPPAPTASTPPPAPSAPPPPAAAPAPPPSGGIGISASFSTGGSSSSAEADATKPTEPVVKPEQRLAIHAGFGFSTRVGASDGGFQIDQRGGITGGVGVFFQPSPLFDLGLSYQHTSLGRDDTVPTAGTTVRIDRRLDSMWLNGRVYPWRSDVVGLFVGIQLGPTWQNLHADGALPPTSTVTTVTPYACSGSASASLAYGGTVGADFDIGNHMAMVTTISGTAYPMSSDTLSGGSGTCASGAGHVSTVDARIGFAYRFDIGGTPASQVASRF